MSEALDASGRITPRLREPPHLRAAEFGEAPTSRAPLLAAPPRSSPRAASLDFGGGAALLQFAKRDAAFEDPHVVDHQNAVEVIVLVLHCNAK